MSATSFYLLSSKIKNLISSLNDFPHKQFLHMLIPKFNKNFYHLHKVSLWSVHFTEHINSYCHTPSCHFGHELSIGKVFITQIFKLSVTFRALWKEFFNTPIFHDRKQDIVCLLVSRVSMSTFCPLSLSLRSVYRYFLHSLIYECILLLPVECL